MSYPYVDPYVTGTAFTDSSGGRSSGDWQAKVMSPVTSATVTTNQNRLGVVDGEGRVVSAYPSQARTATPTAAALLSRGALGLTVVVVTTASTGAPSVVVTIDGFNPGAGTWSTILTSAAITGNGTRRLVVYPTVTEAANLAVATVIPETVRVVLTHGNTDSITYSVDLDWMP